MDAAADMLTTLTEKINPQVIALDVTSEDYLTHYAESHCEWVDGVVYKMSPIRDTHYLISSYLARLLGTYFEIKPIGRLRQDPFVMRLPDVPSMRQPDLQIILNDNPNDLTPTYMNGAADICIEIVSPGSVDMDRGTKYREYEAGGVGEYWIIDPLRTEAMFHRLNEAGLYQLHLANEAGIYQTAMLPALQLHVLTLWRSEANMPGPAAVLSAVQKMLES